MVTTLLDIVTQRLLTKHNKELEVEIRFPTLKIAPDLEDLRKDTCRFWFGAGIINEINNIISTDSSKNLIKYHISYNNLLFLFG